MTWLSNLERFGREDGLWEGCTLGLKIGREEGRRQGIAEVLTLQLMDRYGTLSALARMKLEEARTEQLLVWAHKFLHTKNLDDVFT